MKLIPRGLPGLIRTVPVKPPEEKVQTQDDIVNANRSHGGEIKSILAAINFHKDRIHAEEDPNFHDKMVAQRNNLIAKLADDTNTISDDISQIDEILKYAANAWSSAVVEGYYGKAKWSIAALTKGVNQFRKNVPEDQKDKTALVLKGRRNMMDNYSKLIQHAESVDIANANITNFSLDLKRDMDAILPIRQEIQACQEDKEKLKQIARIKACEMGRLELSELTTEEEQLRDRIKQGITLARRIYMTRSSIEKEKTALNTAENMLSTYRTKLSEEDLKDQAQLIAEHKEVLNSIVKATQEVLTFADKVRLDLDIFQSEMDAVWNSTESKNLGRQSVDFINNTLFQDNKNDSTVVDMAIEMKKELNEAHEQNTASNEALDELFRENTNVNENQNLNVNYNT